MKKNIVLVFAYLTIFASANAQTTITVDNNINSPAQYTNLQTAIDASSPGDILHIAGSAISYGNITVNWPLTLIGAGYNNDYGENTILEQLDLERINAALGASGSKIMGIQFNRYIYFEGDFSGGDISNQKIDNVLIERCSFNYNVTFQSPNRSYSNDTIRNCIFKRDGGTNFVGVKFENSQYNDIIIHNNIFDNPRFDGSSSDIDLSKIFLMNNIFINGTSEIFYFLGTTYANNKYVISNNVFFGTWPEGCENCSFNNNLSYLCNNDQLIYSGNPGSIGGGNIISQNPLFVNYPSLGGVFEYTHDLSLQGGSPGINAGTDGSNIGIGGGLLPFVPGANPTNPQMISISFPGASSVEVGGTLNVTFESKKQN